MTKPLNEALEALIDKYGMSQVLFGLSQVCQDKREHILTSWQDKTTARAWHSDSIAIENLAAKIRSH